MNDHPTLYILMRNDLASMNPGKAMAQASHASNAFVNRVQKLEIYEQSNDSNRAFGKWVAGPQGFGTVLVLAVNESQMRESVNTAARHGLINGIVHDETYPLRDGKSTHFLPLDTCAFIFGDRKSLEVKACVHGLKLHP